MEVHKDLTEAIVNQSTITVGDKTYTERDFLETYRSRMAQYFDLTLSSAEQSLAEIEDELKCVCVCSDPRSKHLVPEENVC